ncbi:MAG TPA: hypothetical protein VFA65_20865 [Bryobacteraceae bacterium]|nr:hypothetical protein [Bryobacteraceae bacterium]
MRPTLDCGWIYRGILRAAALLLPRSERPEWLTEWNSELWYLVSANCPAACFSLKATCFCLGSWKDAAWLRRNGECHMFAPRLWLRSPVLCVSFLTVLAAVTTALAFYESLLQSPYVDRRFALAQLFQIAVAILILPATTPMTLGAGGAAAELPSHWTRLRWWLFLVVKATLILPIVFCGTLDFGPFIASSGLRPQAMLIGYFLGFRWLLVDQRKRCPVCLRQLTNPIRIGQASSTVLDWYGTELMCEKGHGLMYVPGTLANSYSTHRWLRLDSSWRSLFL